MALYLVRVCLVPGLQQNHETNISTRCLFWSLFIPHVHAGLYGGTYRKFNSVLLTRSPFLLADEILQSSPKQLLDLKVPANHECINQLIILERA
jgi:hypothetical protein